jgi:hypothetical protein
MTPFSNAPVEVQVAIINAAASISCAKISAMGENYNNLHDFFKKDLELVCKSVYEQGRSDD